MPCLSRTFEELRRKKAKNPNQEGAYDTEIYYLRIRSVEFLDIITALEIWLEDIYA